MAARRSPLPVIAITFVFALACWSTAWFLQDMGYLPAVLLFAGCAGLMFVMGIIVYVLVTKVERKN